MPPPTLAFFLGLTALIPHVFPISLPANPARGLTNIISADFPADNPLPPSPPAWYRIPDTTLSINTIGTPGPPLPSLTQTLACLAAAQSNIAATIATKGYIPIPHAAWRFSSSGVVLAASTPYAHLATYGRLSSALKGLLHLLTVPGGVGAVQVEWALADDVLGVVMTGDVRAGATGVGAGAVGSGTRAAVTVTPTQSLGIVRVEELDSR